ncbi:GlxA family transcriptional regulator [Phytomonospora endophytica]|uniref:Transcriptional regulator GlxA family with amidase domain n=1 Tax=Phytomonospora endophytica TaxID=714109 RepID=A0A841FTY3_9ACTN|nr:helix-turn-helix domain-containing protein [Phytomonospora endophytica]MBB6039805.1 transcriptional regulator GlxA family with amidase domain [Phytomonospora endophytica]GIG70341.1 AraC family transcriptional regulator [Phytomonospora endophytica]
MHRVAILVVDRVVALDLAIPAQVFTTARADGARLYEVVVCGERRGLTVNSVEMDGGGVELYRLTAPYTLDELRSADTVVVPGGSFGVSPSAEALDALRAAHARGARIASICSGAFVLAAAGLLDGRRATTHWAFAELMAGAFPPVEVDPNVLFIDDGDVLTSAGVATGLDMCLHMVRTDFGAAVAAEVARHIVVAPQREGDQAQFIVHPEPRDVGSLEPTMRWMRDRLGEPVTLAEIAREAAVSPRTLNRWFRAQTGTTPLRWLLRQRVHRAQELLETTALSVEEVAASCGFGTAVNLRQHFAGSLHTTPQAYRRAFRPR